MIGLLFRLLILPVRLAVALVVLLVSLIESLVRANRQRAVRSSRRSVGASGLSPFAAAPGAVGGRAPSGHLWWALSPAYTMGTIAFIPALHAALKLRRPTLWCWFAGLAVCSIVVWVLLGGSGDDDSSGVAGGFGVVLAIGSAVAGTYQALGLRREVFGDTDRAQEMAAAIAAVGRDPAVAQALTSRRRRSESRALAAEDPLLARDLMIGRPDLTRQYVDGGLIDVNHVPETIFVSHVGLSPDQAHNVIVAREQVGRFESLDDMWNLADLPPAGLNMLRDLLIVL